MKKVEILKRNSYLRKKGKNYFSKKENWQTKLEKSLKTIYNIDVINKKRKK